MPYFIEGTSWDHTWMRVIQKGNGSLNVVSNSDGAYDTPLYFDNRKEAEAILPTAQAIAPACALAVVEVLTAYENPTKSKEIG